MAHDFKSKTKNGFKMLASDIRRCRLCACEEGFIDLSDIFEDNPQLELELKISKLLPVVVMPSDPMPHTICPNCIWKLNMFNDFYDISLRAESFFKKFYPSMPKSEIENVDPIVEVLDRRLKLPPRNTEERSTVSPESSSPPHLKTRVDPPSEPSADHFIVTPITRTDSVFTCRKCSRTFTKRSAATEHECVRLEECGELEEMTSGDKCLPPLKIRLFSASSGQFVCSLCQRMFEKKSHVVKHLKKHFVDRKMEKKKKLLSKKRREKVEINCQKTKVELLEPEGDENCEKCLADVDCERVMRSESPVLGDTETNKINEDVRERTELLSNGEDKSDVAVIVLEDDEDDEGEREREGAEPQENGTFPSCVFCDKIFTQKKDLIEHQKEHLRGVREGSFMLQSIVENGECKEDLPWMLDGNGRKFVCKICTMVFTQKKTLMDHEKYHFVDLTEFG